MNKVFCGNCKYYVPMTCNYGGDYCDKKIGSHYEAYGEEFDRIIDYKEANAENNCKHYKRIWWLFWNKEVK